MWPGVADAGKASFSETRPLNLRHDQLTALVHALQRDQSPTRPLETPSPRRLRARSRGKMRHESRKANRFPMGKPLRWCCLLASRRPFGLQRLIGRKWSGMRAIGGTATTVIRPSGLARFSDRQHLPVRQTGNDCRSARVVEERFGRSDIEGFVWEARTRRRDRRTSRRGSLCAS